MPDFTTWLTWANAFFTHPRRDVAVAVAAFAACGAGIWYGSKGGDDK